MATTEVSTGVVEGVTYPIIVQYCPNCTMPPEFCQFGPKYEGCKPWLREHFPHLLPSAAPAAVAPVAPTASADGSPEADLSKLSLSEGGAASASSTPAAGSSDEPGDGDGKKKGGGRGGQVLRGGPKAKKESSTAVVISKKERGRGKCVTAIRGLESFDVKLKDAASALGKKFGAGATVNKTPTGEAQIEIQGDLTAELPPLLESMFHVPEDAIIVKD